MSVATNDASTADGGLQDRNARVDHLRAADSVLGRLSGRTGPLDAEPGDGAALGVFGGLLAGLVGQQISTHAARAIYGRLLALFGDREPRPAELLAADPEALRAAGLSRQKVLYARELAAAVESGTLDLDRLEGLSDDEAKAQLTAVKGVGPWTAEMFLLFGLGRPDVLPASDLTLRQAIRREYRMDELPSAEDVVRLADAWRPYRSLATLYLMRPVPASAPRDPMREKIPARTEPGSVPG